MSAEETRITFSLAARWPHRLIRNGRLIQGEHPPAGGEQDPLMEGRSGE